MKSQESVSRPDLRRNVVSAGVKDKYRNFIRVLENKKGKHNQPPPVSSSSQKRPTVPDSYSKEYYHQLKQILFRKPAGEKDTHKTASDLAPERPQTRESKGNKAAIEKK